MALIITRTYLKNIYISLGRDKVVKITVLGLTDKQVRLGFDADTNINIVRGELLSREEIMNFENILIKNKEVNKDERCGKDYKY